MTEHVLGVVPARGGSKRVPRKNVRTVAGKPMVAHAIDQAEAAERVDEVVVSTDDEEIAAVAREHGGNVPFDRPAELATDTAPSAAVVEHALDWYERRGETFDVVAKVQVTTPLRTADDVDGTVRRLVETGAKSVASVSEFRTPPEWAVEMDADGLLRPRFEVDALWTDDVPRSQDLPRTLYPNGAVFAATVPAFREAGGFYTDETAGYEMPGERAVDVDDRFDLELVRALAERRARGAGES